MLMEYAIFDEGGCDPVLAAKLMETEGTTAQLQREIDTIAEARENGVLLRYLAFAANELRISEGDLPPVMGPARCSRPASADSSSTARPGVVFGTVPTYISSLSSLFMQRWFAARKDNQARPETDEQEGAETGEAEGAETAEAATVSTEQVAHSVL